MLLEAAFITASSQGVPGRLSAARTCTSKVGGASKAPGLYTPARRSPMARMVKCAKLGKDLPGLEFKPWNNDLGQRVYENISQDAWKLWLEHFKMIMNEYRLAGGSEQANQVLFDQAEKFFFGEGAQLPPDYRPPAAKGLVRSPGEILVISCYELGRQPAAVAGAIAALERAGF